MRRRKADLAPRPGPFDPVVAGENETEILRHYEARGVFMNLVLEMPQTQRLFASLDVYFGLAELVTTLRRIQAAQLRLDKAEQPRLLAHMRRIVSRPVLLAWTDAYADHELRLSWWWVAHDLALAYFMRLDSLVLQKPIVIQPDIVMLERLPAARGRPPTEIERQTEWYFRYKIRGETPGYIGRYDLYGHPRRAEWQVQKSQVRRDIRKIEHLLGMPYELIRPPETEDFA